MPKDFGPWQSVYTRFRRWTHSGLREKLHQQIAQAAFGEIRSMDCSHVKVHADGFNPGGGQQDQCMGKTKGGMNTKIAVVVDAIGRAVGLTLDKGNAADLVACRPVEAALYGKLVLADKGFDCSELRQRLVNTGAHVCTPPRIEESVAALNTTIPRSYTGTVTPWKTSLLVLNAIDALPLAMKSWQQIFRPLCCSQLQSIGLGLRFENTP